MLIDIGSEKKNIMIEEDFEIANETRSNDDWIITYDDSFEDDKNKDEIVVDFDLRSIFNFLGVCAYIKSHFKLSFYINI